MTNNLDEIKKRIKSIKTIDKIANAMHLISIAKLQRLRYQVNRIRDFQQNLFDVYQTIFESAKSIHSLKKFYSNLENKPCLYILFTSDMGFCGGFNEQIIRKYQSVRKSNDIIFVIGKKGKGLLNTKKIKYKKCISEISDVPNDNFADELIENIYDWLISGKIGEVKIIFTQFINAISCIPTEWKIIPISVSPSSSTKNVFFKKVNKKEILFEPSVEDTVISILPLYFFSCLYGAYIESKISEYSQRRLSMENANKNAKEFIDKLNIQANTLRQAAITSEINEIVAGAQQ